MDAREEEDMETGDPSPSSDFAESITRAIQGQWEYAYILQSIFNPAPVIVANAQTEVFQDRYKGLIAIFGTARKSNLEPWSKAKALTLLDDLSGGVRKDMSCLSSRSNCSGEGRRYT